jgi:hypothetical protein
VRRPSTGNDVLGGNKEQVRAIELKPLIGRLNDVCHRAFEAAPDQYPEGTWDKSDLSYLRPLTLPAEVMRRRRA